MNEETRKFTDIVQAIQTQRDQALNLLVFKDAEIASLRRKIKDYEEQTRQTAPEENTED